MTHFLTQLLKYLRLRYRLNFWISASLALGYTDRAFNLLLRKQRLAGKMRGKHCYPVYRDFGGGEDVLTEWATEAKNPGNQMLSLRYRSSFTQ